MIEVKFHKGMSKIYPVDRGKFVEITKEISPYVTHGVNGKEAFAICPLCENPVKILGIYAKLEKQRPHARHYQKDIPGLANFDEYTYIRCPYHRKGADYVSEVRKKQDMTAFNQEVLELAHDYFDKCIYIMQKVTGLIISKTLAEEIAMDYMAHPGYMTYDITRENVPYIMALCMRGKRLVKRLVQKNSALYKMLEGKKEIFLKQQPQSSQYKNTEPLYRIESREGFLNLLFNVSRYRYSTTENSELKEYLKLHVGIEDGEGTYTTFAEREIEVDPFLFNKLIHSPSKPKKELQEIADRILIV